MNESLLKSQVYFDCNATTPVLAAAAAASLDAMRTLYGNPSSTHLVGLQAKHILESTRQLAAQVVGADPEQIIFTSGATEAIQTAIFSALQSLKISRNGRKTKLLYGATEHKVVPQTLNHWVAALDLPFQVVELAVDSEGQIQLDQFRKEITDASLLCTMAVNNETGIIQNLDALESILNETSSQVLWLVDCVQALGKTNLKLNSHRIDYAAFSGHKLYAPKGIGFLYVRKGAPFTPLIVGGGQENGYRSGTENLPGVAALGAVLDSLLKKSDSHPFQPTAQLVRYRDQLVSELKKAFPKIQFNSPFEKSVPTTLNFSIPGLSSSEIMDLFDSAGLRVSAGSACNSASVKPSHVLEAMGFPLERSASAIRLSFGPCTLSTDIDRGCQIIRECANALKNTCLLETSSAFEAPENLRDGLLQFRSGSSNSWLLADREQRTCLIIDPCEAVAERMESYIRCQNLSVLAVLDTHSHADHESVRPFLQKILLNQHRMKESQSFDSLGWPTHLASSVVLENKESVPSLAFKISGDSHLVLACVKTPGHTLDSQTYLFGTAKNGLLKKEDIRFAFVGDTILSGGLGRTNFTVSDPKQLFYSLRKLQEVLSPSSLLCSAHDYNSSFATHLNAETDDNKLLALALSPMTPLTLDQFLSRKRQIDLDLTRLESDFQEVVCGVTQTGKCSNEKLLTVPANQLKLYLDQNPTAVIIDVREPQEFSLFKDWKNLGISKTPRNVPLSRFVNFISELILEKKWSQEVLFICRSGGRSLQAAKSLQRLGFKAVKNLEGGIALTSLN